MIKFSVIAPNATYELVRNVPGVNEGSSFNITLNTTGVQNGQSIPYTITGIQQADINEPLTGSFVVQNGQANKVFSVVADSVTEGAEVFTLALDGLGSNVNVTINDTSVAPITDPYWSSVVLLMHMDGTNGSTTFTDERGHTVSQRTGSLSLTTAAPKYGTASLSANGGSIATVSSPEFIFEGPFTIEGWTYSTSSGSRYILSAARSSISDSYTLMQDSDCFRFYSANVALSIRSGAVPYNQWNHFAVTRDESGITRIFANGILGQSGTGGGYTISNTYVVIGDYFYALNNPAFSSPFLGYIDELRITKGVARYVANFTPPTAAFLSA